MTELCHRLFLLEITWWLIMRIICKRCWFPVCFSVPTQQSDVTNGVLFDERLSALTLIPGDPTLARCALSQQLLLQPRCPHVPLRLHRRHVLAPGPTQELWIWTCATFSRICLYKRGGHDRVGKMIVSFCPGLLECVNRRVHVESWTDKPVATRI